MLLEARDPAADLRLGKAQELPSLGEAFRFDNLCEDDKITQIKH
jgi:hypothetical protein